MLRATMQNKNVRIDVTSTEPERRPQKSMTSAFTFAGGIRGLVLEYQIIKLCHWLNPLRRYFVKQQREMLRVAANPQSRYKL